MTGAAPTGREARVGALLDEAREVARRADRDDLLVRLDAATARISSPECHVVVLGEFKKGKSSLLNALLNARVCPTDADIATAVPTRLAYGAEFSITMLTEDPAGDERDGPQALAKSRQLDPAAAEAAVRGEGATAVSHVDVRLPRDLLRTGMVLVDTPGLGGGLASAHAATALRALARADIVLFVSDAGSEYSAPELEMLREAAALCPVLLCVVTKIDLYPEWRRVVVADEEHLARAGLDAMVVATSAPLRRSGIRESDDTLVVESGFPRLTSELLAAADRTAGSAHAAAVAVVLSTVGQVRSQTAARRRGLSDQGTGTKRVAEAAQARARAEELRGVGSRWQQVLADGMDDLHSEMEVDLTARLRILRREAVDQIRSTHPSRLAADLGPWLQRSTNESLLAHTRLLREGAEAVADAVAEQFGSAAWELRSGMDLDAVRPPGQVLRDLQLASAGDRRSTHFEVGLAAVRGGATAAMVTHFLGVALVFAMPPIAPFVLPAVGLMLSGLLAGKSAQSARSGQLRQHWAEAERAVALYLEEVDTVARKELRDALRRTRRQLREAFAQRAGEAYATAIRTAEALTAKVTADEETRDQVLADLDAEIAALADLTSRCADLVDELVPHP